VALTLQNVADDVAFELRKTIDGTSGTGADFNLLVRWIDQTHKDFLHTSIYRHTLRATTPVTTVAGTRSYALTPTDIRRVEAVFNTVTEMFLSPIGEAIAPSTLADPQDRGGAARPDKHFAAHRVSSPFPQYYWTSTVVTSGTAAHTLHIFLPPLATEHAGTAAITVYYIKQAATVSTAAAALLSGEDSRDALVAGVLARAYRYLHYFEQAAHWNEIYEQMKLGESV